MWIKLNNEGRIPVDTECPYAEICQHKKNGGCRHYGKDHGFVYTCASARVYDLVLKHEPDHPQFEGMTK